MGGGDHMKIHGFSMEMGCAGGDPYENIWFSNAIGAVWEETHTKIYGFSMELGLCGRRRHI